MIVAGTPSAAACTLPPELIQISVWRIVTGVCSPLSGEGLVMRLNPEYHPVAVGHAVCAGLVAAPRGVLGEYRGGVIRWPWQEIRSPLTGCENL